MGLARTGVALDVARLLLNIWRAYASPPNLVLMSLGTDSFEFVQKGRFYVPRFEMAIDSFCWA